MNQTRLTVEGDKALLVSTPPSSLFSIFDDDKNGRLSVKEVQEHRAELNSFFSENVKMLDQYGQEGELYFFDIVVPDAFEEGSKQESDHLQFIRRYRWQLNPDQIHLHYDLLTQNQQNMFIQIRFNGQLITTLLAPGQTRLSFPERASSIFLRFVNHGFFHVLSGYDHLLFLLALIITAAGFRQLLGVTTAFTLAHSLTLALSTLGVISLPSKLIESVIVLSICFVALDPLVVKNRPIIWRWFIVFGFGLVHGLGFANALEILSSEAVSQGLSLLAFTMGVELGQILFVTTAFTLLQLGYKQKNLFKNQQLFSRSASLLIAGIAFIWVLERFWA